MGSVRFDSVLERCEAFNRLFEALSVLSVKQIKKATGYKPFVINDMLARKRFPAWETLDKLEPLTGRTAEEIAGRPRQRSRKKHEKPLKKMLAFERRLYTDLSWARPICEINQAAREAGLSYGEYVWRNGGGLNGGIKQENA